MKPTVHKPTNYVTFTIVAFMVYFCLINIWSQNIKQKAQIPSFVAEGTVSSEGFQSDDTNLITVSKVEGTFLFSYSNGEWDVQVTYQRLPESENNLNNPNGVADLEHLDGFMIDCRRIPGGIREIYNVPTNSLSTSQRAANSLPAAFAKTNTFPEWERQEVFLPWLSLSPRPELPLVDSNLMRIHFETALLDKPENEGSFMLHYMQPQNFFLSDFIVTNNGLIFLMDGSTMPLPISYKDTFPQFVYEVLQTTNLSGVEFPQHAILSQFSPLPNGKSAKDIYTVDVSRLYVTRIDTGGNNLSLKNMPTNLEALDSRPLGLAGGRTVNYLIVNDQWPSATSHMQQVAANIAGRMYESPIENAKYTERRLVIILFLILLTIIPLSISFRKLKHKGVS